MSDEPPTGAMLGLVQPRLARELAPGGFDRNVLRYTKSNFALKPMR